MKNSAFETLSDDVLLEMASPKPPNTSDLGWDEEFLMDMAQARIESQIDTKSGADARVRAQVAAAQKPEDRLATLRSFFPDAVPVEVFDPKYGATKYGRGNFIFTNPETGKLTLFDEDVRLFGVPVPTLGDIADVGPEIAETVGGLAGGSLAALGAGTAAAPSVVGTVPAATAAFIAGEGVGSAGAREAYISILDFFGETEDSRTGLEKLVDFGTTATLNAAGGPIVNKVVQGVKHVAGAPIRYVTKSLSTPAKEALERFNRAGVTQPTAGQVTANPLFQLIENSALALLPSSTRVMQENAQRTLLEIEKAAADLAEKYGGRRTFSEAAENTMSAAQAARARYDAEVDAMYGAVREMMPPGMNSAATNTQSFVDKYLAASKTATGEPELNPALEQASKVLRDAAEGQLDFNRLQSFRSSLQKTIRAAESQGALTPQDAKVKELIGYVTRDLDALVEQAGSRQLDMFDGQAGQAARDNILDAYKTANAFVRKNQGKGGDIRFIDKVIRAGEDEAGAALRLVLGGSKEGADRLVALRNKFTPEEYQVLSGFMLGRMGMPTFSAQGAAEIGEGAAKSGAEMISEVGFSPARFITNWNSLSKEAREALFAGTEYQNLAPALDDLVFTIDRVGKNAAAMTNPSGTARALAAMGPFALIGGDLARITGSEGFEYGLGSLIAPYASAKLMTNPDFVKWLAKGVEKAAYDPNTFGQHVRRLAQIYEVNPDIRDELRAVLEGLQAETIEPLPYEGSQSSAAPNALPENNEMRFRQVVPPSTADKLLPDRESMEEQLAAISSSPSVQSDSSIFEPLPTTDMVASAPMMPSPTLLPSEEDRELAMRRQGIGGLV